MGIVRCQDPPLLAIVEGLTIPPHCICDADEFQSGLRITRVAQRAQLQLANERPFFVPFAGNAEMNQRFLCSAARLHDPIAEHGMREYVGRIDNQGLPQISFRGGPELALRQLLIQPMRPAHVGQDIGSPRRLPGGSRQPGIEHRHDLCQVGARDILRLSALRGDHLESSAASPWLHSPPNPWPPGCPGRSSEGSGRS